MRLKFKVLRSCCDGDLWSSKTRWVMLGFVSVFGEPRRSGLSEADRTAMDT